MTSRRPSIRAFTLVELVASMVVVAVIGAVGSMTLQRAAAANANVSARGMLYTEASTAMDRIIRKLQTTPTRAATSPAAPAITAVSATSITWEDFSTLTLTGTDLILRDVAAGDSAQASPVLMGYVSDFAIVPLDESHTNMFTALGVTTLGQAQAANLRRVQVQFTLTRNGQTVTLRSRAFLRCTMATSYGP